jgi:hypothetical protein
MASRRSALKIALIAVGSIVLVLALFVLAVAYFFLGAFHSSKAGDKIAPLTRGLEAMGGHQTCEDGWNGYGWADTSTSWIYTDYQVPDGAAARRFVFKKAAELGYPLLPEMKTTPKTPGAESYNSQPKDQGGLGVYIYRNTSTGGFCADKITVSGKAAVIEITFFADAHRMN